MNSSKTYFKTTSKAHRLEKNMSTVPILDLSVFDDLKKQPEFLAHLKHTARHVFNRAWYFCTAF